MSYSAEQTVKKHKKWIAENPSHLASVKKEHAALLGELRSAKHHLRLAVTDVDTWRYQVSLLQSDISVLADVIDRQSEV